MTWKQFGLVLLVSLASGISSVGIYKWMEGPDQNANKTNPAIYTKLTDQLLATPAPQVFSSSAPTDFIDAAGAVTSAVVNIKTSGEEYGFWNSSTLSSSSGSGVIISPDGFIATNNHVIEDGKKIDVTLNDRRKFKAEVIGTDPSTDIALLKIEAGQGPFPFVRFGNSDSIRVGEWVLAVGNPFDLESTVTAGIVSAKGRNIDILEDTYKVESFIQTDAAVNPGNSGGALVNSAGELVGINTAIITRSGRYEGYSFAVPANLVRKVVRDLREFGAVQRAILGIGIDDVTNEMADRLDLDAISGVYISRVTPNSGAAEAGLQRGDVILRINGVQTNSSPELQEQIARYRPGNTVDVDYVREGQRLKAAVTLKNKSNTTSMVNATQEAFLNELGLEIRELSKMERRKVQTNGVKVISITRGSIIERTNMDPGFIITKINDQKVTSSEEVIEALKKARGEVLLEGVYENYPGEWGYKFDLR